MEEQMSPILIGGAMDIEISLLLDKMDAPIKTTIGGYSFWEGTLFDHAVVVYKTEIGMTNAASATTVGILHFHPRMVLNLGTAGGHDPSLSRMALVLGERCFNVTSFESLPRKQGEGVHLEEWKHTDFKDFDGSHCERDPLACDAGLLERAMMLQGCWDGQLVTGVLASGDIWNREVDRILYLHHTYGTSCEDMESAAVYAVANRFGVPVLGIRVISNNEILGDVYDRNTATQCQRFVLHFLTLL